jgi:hypothetical protein
MTLYENTRIDILKYLWDVEIGKIQLERDTSLGVQGVTLFEALNSTLTTNEFIAQLDYLEDKGMIEKRPSSMPRTRTKEEELQVACYKITSYGIDIVEGSQEDPGLPNIQQIINIGKITSSQSNIAIGTIGSEIDISIKHANSDEIEKLLTELAESLGCIPASDERAGVQRLLETMKLELSNPETDQDNNVLSSLLRRLNKRLEPYQKPLSILASLAAILGLAL